MRHFASEEVHAGHLLAAFFFVATAFLERAS